VVVAPPHPLGNTDTGNDTSLSEETVSVEEKVIEKEPVEPEPISLPEPPLEKGAVAPQEPDHPAGAETEEQLQGAGIAISTSLIEHPPPLCTAHVMVLSVDPLETTEGATVTE